MQGIAEADETFFLESLKGKRHLPRKARKRGGKAAKRGTSAEQIPVLGLLLAPDAILCTDGASAYTVVARNLGVTRRPVNLSRGIRVWGAYHKQVTANAPIHFPNHSEPDKQAGN